jgi:hypothetical protein
MDANRAFYWIALGVLALGLNSEYRLGRFVALHRAADHAESVLCRISTRAEQTLAAATLPTKRDDSLVDNMLASANEDATMRVQSELLREQARGQAEVLRSRLRAQAELVREQAEMQRAEVEQIRLCTRSQVRLAHVTAHRVTVTCQPNTRIDVNTGLESANISSDVDE